MNNPEQPLPQIIQRTHVGAQNRTAKSQSEYYEHLNRHVDRLPTHK